MLAPLKLTPQEIRDRLYDELDALPRVEEFTRFAFPITRRVFPSLIAQQIVSVQPMMAPTSLIFYQQYLYGEDKPAVVKSKKLIELPMLEPGQRRFSFTIKMDPFSAQEGSVK